MQHALPVGVMLLNDFYCSLEFELQLQDLLLPLFVNVARVANNPNHNKYCEDYHEEDRLVAGDKRALRLVFLDLARPNWEVRSFAFGYLRIRVDPDGAAPALALR